MINEVVGALAPEKGGVFVDATFGAGGYSRALLDAGADLVLAIDRDDEAAQRAALISEEFKGRFKFFKGCFGDVSEILPGAGYDNVDGFVMDLGVSSMQIDTPSRGFSFRADGPLDMRMDSSAEVETAADIVNTWSEEDLAHIIKVYGEERFARRLAKEIVRTRSEEPFRTTDQLANLIRRVVPRAKDNIDPATRTFQALRIAVNDELSELARGLVGAEQVLANGGRLVVVSFHSLEDTIVKRFLVDRSGTGGGQSRYLPVPQNEKKPSFDLVSKKALSPGSDEVASNSRSRSAKLRVAIRNANPPWVDAIESESWRLA
jgi:16S rRNA (cytosine1402-N4)-methyltransferase